MKSRGRVADAFWVRLGGPPAEMGRIIVDPFGDKLQSKIKKKNVQKGIQKSMLKK